MHQNLHAAANFVFLNRTIQEIWENVSFVSKCTNSHKAQRWFILKANIPCEIIN